MLSRKQKIRHQAEQIQQSAQLDYDKRLLEANDQVQTMMVNAQGQVQIRLEQGEEEYKNKSKNMK